MRYMGLAIYCLSGLLGCAVATKPDPVTVEVPGPVQRIPVPEELTRPCEAAGNPGNTGELLAAFETARASLDDCNSRLAQIRALK